ncbi:MAG: glycoside hydrolase family 27 protein [Acidobacteriaceae bacterium]
MPISHGVAVRVHGRKAVGILVLFVVVFGCCQLVLAQAAPDLQANLAPTPPMGWASWNHFFCDYNEQTIRDQADALVSTGMRDLGYRYVLIQECIAPGRDLQGNLIVDPVRFPHGMKSLADYIHARGLKAGIYTDVGPYTCYAKPRYQGSYDHEDQDAGTFASWGMDLVEMDYCNRVPDHSGKEVYERMAAAIRKTHRPMLFYICSWGNEAPWTWAQGKAQLWRTTGDISSRKDHVEWASVAENFQLNARHAAFSAPNGWNDPDMLEVGNPGLNLVEAKSHFSMWVISAAPLWAGNDLTRMDASIRDIYTNSEAIAIDQDPLGAGPTKVREDRKGLQVWTKPLGSIGSGASAVLLLNLTSVPAEIAVQWSDLGLSGKAEVRDLWAHQNLSEFAKGYRKQIPPHGSVLLKVKGNFSWASGAIYEAEWPGNLRGGTATYLACHKCSEGYAVSLPATNDSPNGSSLEFTHIVVPKSGSYSATLYGVHAFAGGEIVQMRVNEDPPIQIPLQGFENKSTAVPIQLNRGNNSIQFTSIGTKGVDIDRLRLNR